MHGTAAASKGTGIRRTIGRWLVPATLVLLLLAGGPFAFTWWTSQRFKARTYTAQTVPPKSVAIVFGAGYWPDGRLSDILADRVSTAVDLYRAGRVQKLLMTGDNRVVEYNEPQRMREYALELGVPDEDIVLDYAGRRTYDSCYRAKHIFRVDGAVLVTQAYHLPRALLTANGLGIDAVGVPADQRSYRLVDYYALREVPATLLACWQVYITRPEPVMGDPLPIFPEE
ncbi:MAG: SanA/YdcF family protein [Anaerolineae bacterium]